MTSITSEEKASPLIYFIIAVLPFILCYWMVPFLADQTIGQDYPQVSIQYQMELLFSIKTGSFPLYSPGFAAGHSSSALTLGQVFHPLPYLASALPGYWNGHALDLNTLVRLCTLAVAHLLLFSFLRQLRLTEFFSFLLSGITVYNLRMLDLFRYGASLEAYTGHLFLCVAIGSYFISKTGVKGPLSIIGATYWLVCSGHPQMMYYGLIGSGLFMLVAPFFISIMLPGRQIDFKTAAGFWMRAGSFMVCGVLLSSAYILPFYFDFIASNVTRVGSGYIWALGGLTDTLVGTLNSFFAPLHSDVHGAFGGSSLVLMAAILPLLLIVRVKIPRPVWVIWGLGLLVFLYMQGERVPLHRWVWEYFPFASSFRVAGRISIIMPVLIMLLLAWLTKTGPVSIRTRGLSLTCFPVTILAAGALLLNVFYYLFLIAVYILFPGSGILEIGPLSPVSINSFPFPSRLETLVTLSGMASLALLVFYHAGSRAARLIGIIMILTTFVQVGSVLRYGTWIAERHDKPTFEQMMEQKKAKLDYYHNPGSGMYSSSVLEQLDHSFMEPFLGKIYTQMVPVSSYKEAFNKMAQERTPKQVFVEGYKPEQGPDITAKGLQAAKSYAELIYSSFNRLEFRITAPSSAFFGLSYPYTGHWTAWLNGRKAEIYRANGLAHAVKIPEGEGLIEFRYWSPAAFWGMLLSCTTFVIIGLYFSIQSLSGVWRVFVTVMVLVLGIGVFALWHHSLYAGDNLDTHYIWTPLPSPPTPNLAYGKKTWVSAPSAGGFLRLHSSRAVDGDVSPDSGFITGKEADPSWAVDLHGPEKISTIIVYESTHDASLNIRPLNISVSQDGQQWLSVASESSPVDHQAPVRIVLEPAKTARYIRVQASGICRLSLDEVEVYGGEDRIAD